MKYMVNETHSIKWKDLLGIYSAGNFNKRKSYKVMNTPLAWQLIGMNPLPLEIDGARFDHILNHDGMNLEVLKNLPEVLENPLMILDTYADRKVVVVELKDQNDATIITPIDVNQERHRTLVNILNNAYGKNPRRQELDGTWIQEKGTDFNWFIQQNMEKGRVLYINIKKSIQWMQSERGDSPNGGKLLDALSAFIISKAFQEVKTEEDLVKFKLQKEEEYKAAAAHEAANEKDSSLQTHPADESHLQLRGTASYEPMVSDSIKAVNKEEAKMTAENQARKEAVSDYADSYREELADVCAASEESFTPAQNEKLQESTERLYKEMREFERSEGVCGPDQDAWDSFAALHERNVRSILAAKDISEATGRESKASEEAAGEAVRSVEESIVFISQSRVDLLHKQKVYEDQIEELRRRVEDISEAKTLGVGKEEDFTRTLAAAAGFLKQIEGLRREAGNLPRKPASEMFKASRSSVRKAYFAVKLAPTQLRRHIDENMPQEVSRVLQQAAVAFEQGSESLGQAKEAIVRTARSRQSAAAFYREAWMEEAKASGISPEIEERVALRMAKAGMGAYTIRVTLERESPLREDMKAGKAKEIAEAAKAKAADAREAEREEDHRR